MTYVMNKSYTCLSALFLGFIAGIFLLNYAFAATSEDCLTCHGDPTLSVERKGKIIPLYVDGAVFTKSVHGKIGCVTCHEDANVTEFPHPERLKEVRCSTCHKAEQEDFDISIHGQTLKRGALYAPDCIECHGKHNIVSKTNLDSPTSKINIPALCGMCHREDSPVVKLYDIPEKHVIEHYRESIHGEGLIKKGLIVTATCTDCHSAHNILPHTDSRSTVSLQNIARTCSRCHAMIEQVHKKVIRGELWEEKPGAIPACVDCHSPHEIRKESLVIGMADKDCLKCHERPDITKGANDELQVVYEDISSSVHDKIQCVKCHSDITPQHERPCDTAGRVDCSNCHVKESEDYTESAHGQLHFFRKDPDAPYCTDCHGTHRILSKLDNTAEIFRRNIPNLCAKCHREGEKAATRYKGKEINIVKSYQMSTHGKGVIESGLIPSAVCIDCHTSHRELPADDMRSSVNPSNLVQTCGRCHYGIYEIFSKSIHSSTVSKTKDKLPVCIDCHTAHDITRIEKDKFLHEVVHQCGSCHKYVAQTYLQTYHGKAYQLGHLKAAKCSDCHGSHDILSINNPNSHLSRKNAVKTCQKCHPGATRQFTGYLTHATHHSRYKYPILFYTFWGMTLLLIGTFIFFGVHTILWLPKSFRRLKERRGMRIAEEPQQFIRFAIRERLIHLVVIVSFFGLAITGMMLKFAHMPWAVTVSKLIGGVKNAGAIHRLCAIITFGYFSYHLWTLYSYKRKNKLTLKELVFHKDSPCFKWQDVHEFFQTMKWFFGMGKRPQYGRWTYWEKFDYFAVFWGVAIIGLTGLILWFPEFFTHLLPGWVINVATIIHSDEALLAVGFIFTIHFFNTHLRPEVFPMDPVIFTGRTPLPELEYDRPREYKELRETGELNDKMAPPVSARLLKLSYGFGLTCLAIGIILTVLIIYSMLFGYK